MALQGTLKDFGVADILQLVAQQGKSGRLRLKGRAGQVSITLRKGLIVGVEVQGTPLTQILVESLLLSEKLTIDEAKQTLERSERVKLSAALPKGRIAQQDLAEVRDRQMLERLCELFSWKEGAYRFEGGDGNIEEEVGPFRPEIVLMEAFRQLDEWPRIRKIIPDDEQAFEPVGQLPTPPAESHDDFGGEAVAKTADGIEIGENERKVFAVLEPSRSVRKIAALARVSHFDAASALCRLLQARLARPATLAPSAQGHQPVKRHKTRTAMTRVVSPHALGILGLVAALMVTVSQLDLNFAAFTRQATQTPNDPITQRFIARAQKSRIEAALEVYRMELGELPTVLEALVEQGLLESTDLSHPWENSYYYRRVSANSFVLLAPLR